MTLFKSVMIMKKKTGIVLVWLSAQGTGKSILVDFIGRMIMGSEDSGDLGSSYLHVLDETKVVGKFNGCLAGKLLVTLDEAGTGPYRDLANIFKGLVSEKTMQIEKKGMEASSIDNSLNFIVLSNGERPVKVENSSKSDRRFAVFDVSERYKGNYKYFQELHEQLNSPLSAYHFYMYLKQYDTKGLDLRDIPDTEARRDLRSYDIPKVIKWMSEYVFTKDFRDWQTSKFERTEKLFHDFKAYMDRSGFRDSITKDIVFEEHGEGVGTQETRRKEVEVGRAY
jgi:hypothetical protein